jgi:hypothetical protein
MNINWKFMVPVAIVLILVVSFLLKLVDTLGLVPDGEAAANILNNIPQIAVLLLGNLVLGVIVMNMLRNQGRRQRHAADEAVRAVAAGD